MTKICELTDLVEFSGVAAMLDIDGKDEQIAIFYLPDTESKVYAIGNWCPLGKANVMSRGLVGNIGDELVVASPLYKQHFNLETGVCIEEDASVPVYPVEIKDNAVYLNS